MPPARATRPSGAVGPSKSLVQPSCSSDLEEIMETLFENQRLHFNYEGSYVDVVLILKDGVIPVHGVLLEAVSPFFRTCFESQGSHYFGTREVILPHYRQRTMQKVVQLIYNQPVYCQDESETKEVQAAIRDLGIKLSSTLESVKVRKQVYQSEVKAISHFDYQNTKKMKPFVKPSARRSVGRAFDRRDRFMYEESSSSEHSGTDSEVDDETNDLASWFNRKLNHYPQRKTDYPFTGEATNYIPFHKRNRCYICFRVCEDTQMLFQHYARVHRKGGGAEGSVVCPWCKESIAFKGLSNHIITAHINDTGDDKKQPAGRSNSRKQPVSKDSQLKRSHAAASKTVKLDELKVGNLDCTFTLERDNGEIWVFAVEKKRDVS